MSENIVIILLIALLSVVLILVGVILYLFKELIKERKSENQQMVTGEREKSSGKETLTPTIDRLRDKISQNELGFDDEVTYCVNHPQDHGKGLCAICQDSLCEECLKEHDGLNFCGAHFRLYLGHDWVELETIKTTPETPESAFPIYDFKKDLWEKERLPAIISTHYKINIETDKIESFVRLLVRTQEEEALKERFQNYKH